MSQQTSYQPQARATPSTWQQMLDRWRGKRVTFDLSRYQAQLQRINQLEATLTALDDDALRDRWATQQRAIQQGTAPKDTLPEVFALLRESARRTLGLRPYDIQMIGGIALFEGHLIEMETGEGKTLVATLAAALHALAGKGVHILTFNDYLASRDGQWMGPVYAFFGLEVGVIQAADTPAARRRAYAADITYLTAKEAGFDYLRDGLAYDPTLCTQRKLHVAIVDEADSILIDEARIPLVIAGSRDRQTLDLTQVAALVETLSPSLHYELDQEKRNASLTEDGITLLEAALGFEDLHTSDAHQRTWLTAINQAIHAKALLQRDIDYIVRDGVAILVDELTGRTVPDRQWPDGLQAAIEAKEGLRQGEEGEILGSITLQHFFRLYQTLAGMTATARPEEEELQEFYQLGVVVLPTHHPCIRNDQPAQIYTHTTAKQRAIFQLVEAAHQQRRPVLIGTASIRESETLAKEFQQRGLPCQVLNAKHDAQEAEIIAEAGAPGAITISTNMAGRGTDIRLGGKDEAQRDEALASGGLLVIGTNRHESRRIDQQLRGRAGRQGDPGTSMLLISLEDETMVRNGIAELLPASLRLPQDGPLDHPLVQQRTQWAQRVIEGQLLDQRRNLWQYASFVESQRRMLRDMRDQLLHGDNHPQLWRTERPERTQQLIDCTGQTQAAQLERLITIECIDRLWADYLQTLVDIREHIHLVRLGNQSPLQEFVKLAGNAFALMLDQIDEDSLTQFDQIELTTAALERKRHSIKGPSSTWTYMVDDNPYRDILGLQAAANLALGIGAAIYAPLYMLVGIYHRWFRKKKKE